MVSLKHEIEDHGLESRGSWRYRAEYVEHVVRFKPNPFTRPSDRASITNAKYSVVRRVIACGGASWEMGWLGQHISEKGRANSD